MVGRYALTLFLIFAAAASSPAGEIHLRRECACSGALVTLGQVADIYTVDAAQQEQLAAVELFPPPAGGKTRNVSAREIQDLLAARGVDLRANRLCGASMVMIRFAAPQPAPAAEATVPSSRNDRPEIQLASALVAARPLSRGEIVHQEDVQLTTLPARSIRGDSISDLRDVVGKELTRSVGAGQTLPQSALQSPRLVRRNETVTLLVKAGGIQVRTFAKALDDGGRGDAIQLQSLTDRNAKYTALVVGYKEVEMLAGEPVVHQRRDPPSRLVMEAAPGDQPPLVSSVNQPVAIGAPSPRNALGLRVQRSDAAQSPRYEQRTGL